MIDIRGEIEAVQRELGTGRIPAGEGQSIRLRRTYEARIDEVWDALTNPERISRWFLPVSGDYRVGGRYQLEGNAGGEILACERPHRLRISWVYGDANDPANVSEVELNLSPAGDEATVVELAHTAVVPEEFWTQFGPGATGVGWDQGLLGLALHLRGARDALGDPEAWQLSDEGREFSTRSSEAWGEAYRATGANPDAVAQAVANTTAFYTTPAPEA